MIVGGYSLHLYCGNGKHCQAPIHDSDKPLFGDFAAHTSRLAKQEAKTKGWVFKHGDCYCRYCGDRAPGLEPLTA